MNIIKLLLGIIVIALVAAAAPLAFLTCGAIAALAIALGNFRDRFWVKAASLAGIAIFCACSTYAVDLAPTSVPAQAANIGFFAGLLAWWKANGQSLAINIFIVARIIIKYIPSPKASPILETVYNVFVHLGLVVDPAKAAAVTTPSTQQ